MLDRGRKGANAAAAAEARFAAGVGVSPASASEARFAAGIAPSFAATPQFRPDGQGNDRGELTQLAAAAIAAKPGDRFHRILELVEADLRASR